jgi:hypothetical protein
MRIRYEDLGGRRWLLTLAVLVTSTAVLWFGKIDAAVWRDVMIGIVGIYVAGNTAQKIKGTAPAEAQ